MKTLIITGTYQSSTQPATMFGVRETVIYDITIYGQSPESQEVQFITAFKMELSGYDELQEICRAHYAKYFNTDLFNIISLENLNRKVA